jgi:lysophospholipase
LKPGQLKQLRDRLPLFGTPGPVPQGLDDYCAFYGLDFQQRFPPVQHQLGTVASGEFKLAVQRWLLPGATSNLLLVHGYFDHAGLYGKLIEFGLAHNCNVLIFDLPGHGLSSGEPAVIDDFTDYGLAVAAVLDAAELPTLPLWAMAQSTGCAALVEYARHYNWNFSAAVMLAPLLRPAGWPLVRLSHSLLRYFTTTIERKFTENSSDAAFLAFLRKDPLQSRLLSLHWVAAMRRWIAGLPVADLGVGPVLVLQGDADGTVDWRYNTRAYCRLFPGSRVELLAGAGHQLANEVPQLLDPALEVVAEYLGEAGVPLDISG